MGFIRKTEITEREKKKTETVLNHFTADGSFGIIILKLLFV